MFFLFLLSPFVPSEHPQNSHRKTSKSENVDFAKIRLKSQEKEGEEENFVWFGLANCFAKQKDDRSEHQFATFVASIAARAGRFNHSRRSTGWTSHSARLWGQSEWTCYSRLVTELDGLDSKFDSNLFWFFPQVFTLCTMQPTRSTTRQSICCWFVAATWTPWTTLATRHCTCAPRRDTPNWCNCCWSTVPASSSLHCGPRTKYCPLGVESSFSIACPVFVKHALPA